MLLNVVCVVSLGAKKQGQSPKYIFCKTPLFIALDRKINQHEDFGYFICLFTLTISLVRHYTTLQSLKDSEKSLDLQRSALF